MKVCFFNRSYPPAFGSTGQLLAELAEGLVADHDCQVSVVVGHPVGGDRRRTPTREERHGVQIFRARGTRFSPARLAGRVMNYLTYFLAACLLALRVPRADVVVALTDPPIIGLAALLAARRSRARFVFLCQDVFPEVARLVEGFRSERLDRWLDRANRFLLRKADAVVALGETMRDRLVVEKGADPRKVTVIHNWADCSAIVPGPKVNPFSLAHGLADRFVVMHSGNMGLSQALDKLLRAARRLREYPDIVVALVGDGTKRAELEAQVRAQDLGNVVVLPYQPKEMLRHSFAAADVFVVSLRRGLAGYIVPSKLYGILAAGRPYVAAVDSTSEVAAITRKYECGLLARPEDPEDLVRQILILYRDRRLAERLGENGRRSAFEFDRGQQVGEYYGLLRDVCRAGERRGEPLLKRPLDMLLSGAGLLLSAPFWALIALGIKLQDGGPVFYAQERIGRGGRPFRSWKFRSMVPDADARFGPLQAGERDVRVTPLGRVLRATALDELPQLWNIFRGDMSFVGPRALMSKEIERAGDGRVVSLDAIQGFDERHRVRPGLTGLAQVYAPRDIVRPKKFRYDLLYIRRQRLRLDLKLILLSVWISLHGRWERRGRKF